MRPSGSAVRALWLGRGLGGARHGGGIFRFFPMNASQVDNINAKQLEYIRFSCDNVLNY